jgi:hypothetical protein
MDWVEGGAGNYSCGAEDTLRKPSVNNFALQSI